MQLPIDIRKIYLEYFTDSLRKHANIEPSPLVLQNDATTLFNSSGMQPLVPYLSGRETHPKGKRLVDIQPCIRTQDIEEVGDTSHTTFFEMLGNWSLGDYFKEEQIAWVWDFFTKMIGLPAEKLYITVFDGTDGVPRDEEAAEIWKKLGVPEDHIYFYGVDDNWWSRSGTPESMPAGEIGGPCSEIFYDFGSGPHKGPASDGERFLEIGNSVFIQYAKQADGTLNELPQKNVDFGGGLERIQAAYEDQSDIFKTSFFKRIIEEICSKTDASYENDDQKVALRIIADHLRAATFLIADGIVPSNKEHGYVLRRLLRRAAMKMIRLKGKLSSCSAIIDKAILSEFDGLYGINRDNLRESLIDIVDTEMKKFQESLDRGLRTLEKAQIVDEKLAFDLLQSNGFPFEITQELALEKGIQLDVDVFEKINQEHKDLSRTASAGKFKGGLAGSSDQVVKYHTATHLMQQALKEVFGDIIRQEGSNITQERLRFDTRLDHKPTPDELTKVEELINYQIKAALPVRKIVLPKDEAEKIGASAFFREKYSDEVSVYYIGGEDGKPETAYSKEFCGGPHVENTSDIGAIEIYKAEKNGAQSVRLYARNPHAEGLS